MTELYKSFKWRWVLSFWGIVSMMAIGVFGAMVAISSGPILVGVALGLFSLFWFRSMVNAGWRWRVRDGNRLPMEHFSMDRFLRPSHSNDQSPVGYREALTFLSPRGRQRLTLRSVWFCGFIVFAAMLGLTSSALTGVLTTAGALAVFVWFLSWVRAYVATHGPNPDPWADR